MSEIELQSKTPRASAENDNAVAFDSAGNVIRAYMAPYNPTATAREETGTDVLYGEDSTGAPVKLIAGTLLTEVWSGTLTDQLNLPSIPGGYPGDGLYVLTLKLPAELGDFTAMMHFIDGERCFNVVRTFTDTVEVSKDAGNFLSINGAEVKQIRRFRA